MVAANHTPVLLDETIQALCVQPGGRYVDGTLGGGGHAAAILEHSLPGGQLLGIDADPEAVKIAGERLAPYQDAVLLLHENFIHLRAICIKYDFMPVHGILFDLGLSSLQLGGQRGFSFQEDAPLDMRFNPEQGITAAEMVNTMTEDRLAHLIWTYGEERKSRQIARSIVARRPVKTTFELVSAVEKAVGGRRGRLHPATRTFQALRIAVNSELENLEITLEQAIELLGFEGRLVVISYHSLEDRIVKQVMVRESRDCICPPGTVRCVCHHKARLRIVNRKVVTPTDEEILVNPRSRSARIRAAERIISPDEYHERTEEERVLTEPNGQGWRRPAILKRLRTAFMTTLYLS
ncbi:MAG: 16S rRNA (cytosine(1402)-N(4))-methyltransferase RsmH [Chloroflexota bacterium]